MLRTKKVAYVHQNCVSCGSCVKSCPLGAISIDRGMYATVNLSKCVGCGRCATACPAGMIEIVEREAASA